MYEQYVLESYLRHIATLLISKCIVCNKNKTKYPEKNNVTQIYLQINEVIKLTVCIVLLIMLKGHILRYLFEVNTDITLISGS